MVLQREKEPVKVLVDKWLKVPFVVLLDDLEELA